MGGDFTGRTWGHLNSGTRDDCEKAARYVASVAHDTADCTQLLAALGLLPARHPAALRDEDHGLIGYRRGCRCKRCVKANRARLDRQRSAGKGATS
jgi:hypothetical protein